MADVGCARIGRHGALDEGLRGDQIQGAERAADQNEQRGAVGGVELKRPVQALFPSSPLLVNASTACASA